MQDQYNEAWEAGYKAAMDKCREQLTDAAVMFENIQRNRNMPPEAQTLNQYVAKGREIRAFLNGSK